MKTTMLFFFSLFLFSCGEKIIVNGEVHMEEGIPSQYLLFTTLVDDQQEEKIQKISSYYTDLNFSIPKKLNSFIFPSLKNNQIIDNYFLSIQDEVYEISDYSNELSVSKVYIVKSIDIQVDIDSYNNLLKIKWEKDSFSNDYQIQIFQENKQVLHILSQKITEINLVNIDRYETLPVNWNRKMLFSEGPFIENYNDLNPNLPYHIVIRGYYYDSKSEQYHIVTKQDIYVGNK